MHCSAVNLPKLLMECSTSLGTDLCDTAAFIINSLDPQPAALMQHGPSLQCQAHEILLLVRCICFLSPVKSTQGCTCTIVYCDRWALADWSMLISNLFSYSQESRAVYPCIVDATVDNVICITSDHRHCSSITMCSACLLDEHSTA